MNMAKVYRRQLKSLSQKHLALKIFKNLIPFAPSQIKLVRFYKTKCNKIILSFIAVSSSTNSNCVQSFKQLNFECAQSQVADLVLVANNSKMEPKEFESKAVTDKTVFASTSFEIHVKTESIDDRG